MMKVNGSLTPVLLLVAANNDLILVEMNGNPLGACDSWMFQFQNCPGGSCTVEGEKNKLERKKKRKKKGVHFFC